MSIRSEGLSPDEQRKRRKSLAETGKRCQEWFKRAERHEAIQCPFCKGSVIAHPRLFGWRRGQCERCGFKFWAKKKRKRNK